MGYKPVSLRPELKRARLIHNRFYTEHIHSLRTLRRRLVSSKIRKMKSRISDAVLAALYFIGGVRVTFSTGIAAGGNLAYWFVSPLPCLEPS
jgi:hypothetical protein